MCCVSSYASPRCGDDVGKAVKCVPNICHSVSPLPTWRQASTVLPVRVLGLVLILVSVVLNIASLRLRRVAARSIELERPALVSRATRYVMLGVALLLLGAALSRD